MPSALLLSAEKAGLRRGDVVLSINGERITETRELSLKVAMLAPGTTVRLKIVRNRREMEIPVVLGEQPPERPVLGSEPEPSVTRALEGVRSEERRVGKECR